MLVHGCNSSIAKFKNLAEVFQSRGQQAVCFTYDDRDSLISVADELNVALTALSPDLGSGKVTVIGHSQGGLIARHAASSADQVPVHVERLLTVSTPFAGIRSARDCGSLPMHIFSFGITVGICQSIAGRKWTEIHERAPFILSPPPLPREVERHLAVITDESGSCRRYEESKCVDSDDVFSLDEQSVRNLVDRQIDTKIVRSGHTAIVGEEQIVPVALIDLLEQEKVLKLPASATLEARRQLLEQIYGPSKGSVSQPGVTCACIRSSN